MEEKKDVEKNSPPSEKGKVGGRNKPENTEESAMIRLKNLLKSHFGGKQKPDEQYISEFYDFLDNPANLITMPPEIKTKLVSILAYNNELYSALVFAYLKEELYTKSEFEGLSINNLRQTLLLWIKANSKEFRDMGMKEFQKYYNANAQDPNAPIQDVKDDQLIMFQATDRLENISPKELLRTDLVYLDFAYYVIVCKDPEKEKLVDSQLSLESQRQAKYENLIFGSSAEIKSRRGTTITSVKEYKLRKKQYNKKWRTNNPGKHRKNVEEFRNSAKGIEKRFGKYDEEETRFKILQKKNLKAYQKGYVSPKQATLDKYNIVKKKDETGAVIYEASPYDKEKNEGTLKQVSPRSKKRPVKKEEAEPKEEAKE